MDSTALFVIGIAIAAVLVAGAVFTVAFRRGPSSDPVTGTAIGVLDKRTIRRDLEAHTARQVGSKEETAVVTLTVEETTIEKEVVEPLSDPLAQREELTPEEFGVARRRFFNRAIVGLFGGAFLGGLAVSFLAFLWPKLSGGFGSAIPVGKVADLRREIARGDGTFVPKFLAAAQAWIVPYSPTNPDTASQFDELPVTAGGEGGEIALMALWQRCVHLGCRVPSCPPSQGFECPCHGSKYNLHGEYEDGPAPRNLDRFGVEVNGRDELVVRTGDIYETPRAKTKSVAYPQGPNCI